MRKGFLIYEEMRKYLTIYEEKAVIHIWLCNCATDPIWISWYVRKILFDFYQCKIRILWEIILLFGNFLSMLRTALIGRDRICVLGPIVDVDSCLLFYFQVIYGSHILFCKFLSADLFAECKKLAYLSRKVHWVASRCQFGQKCFIYLDVL
jgi:hypothetical protein